MSATKWLPFFFVTLVLVATFPTVAAQNRTIPVGGTNTVDREALLAIKSRITDPRGLMSSWNESSVDFCQWQGVTCSLRHQRVTALNLSSGGLLGSLSPYIGNLSFLRAVLVQNNSLSGEIPPQLGRLFRLQEVGLHNNSFTGNIPTTITNCTNLQVLRLGYNNLVGKIPDGIGSLSMLRILIVHENSLQGGIPQFIGNLTMLDTLSFMNCGLGGTVPDVFHRLSNLRRYSMSGNNLVGTIPPSLYNLSSLEQLFIDDNRLTGPLPPSIFSSPELHVLDVAKNNLSGKLVINSREVCQLVIVSLSWNNFGSGEDDEMRFIDGLSICNNLGVLLLNNNQLRGFLPESLGNLSTSVYQLDLASNALFGSIPNVYGNRGELEGLILNGNQLDGEVPRSLSKCQSLKVLDIGNNNLNDTFPHWLESLPNLLVLVLKSNNFHGIIETSSTIKLPFPSLQVLDLSHNWFAGQLPRKYFQNFNAMKNIVRRSTKPEYFYYSIALVIKGKEQYFSQIFVEYSIIDVSDNRFEGQIPYILGSLNSLIVLSLSHNSLTGQIPHALEGLSEIESLDLSCNQLTGEIPQSLVDLTFLEYLNLSQNHLMGRIPSGNQFDTFEGNSFGGNPKVCGRPLPKKCNKSPHKPHVESDGDGDEEESAFTWRVVMLGYGCGTLIGLVMGYLMLSTGRPIWFNAIADAGGQKILKRQNGRIYTYI